MSIQIFKKEFPNELLFNLLNDICMKNDKHYILNTESFKKGLYDESIQQFIEFCKPYYHNSKKKYLEKKITYNSFVTIVRQICNSNKIIYTSKIKYINSTYDIIYYIYIE